MMVMSLNCVTVDREYFTCKIFRFLNVRGALFSSLVSCFVFVLGFVRLILECKGCRRTIYIIIVITNTSFFVTCESFLQLT